MLEAALREYPSDQVQPETLHLMQRGNELLQNMVDEFCKTRSGPAKCEVACFWELKTSDVGAIVGGQKIMVSLCFPFPSLHYELLENNADLNIVALCC